MTIIEFIEDMNLINDQSLSVAQKTALKAVYGLPLANEELAVFKQTTGLLDYHPKEWGEATFILGRRSGKSDKLASNIAIFEATMREHKCSVGEIPIVMVVASELKRQAKIVYNYILAKLERSKVLSRLIKNITTDEIALTNGVVIRIYPCHVARGRGASLACFIGDEAAWWKHEGKNIDKEVLDSARPGLSFSYSKMIKISSPWMMRGEIYEDFKQYWGKPNDDVLVFQGDTLLFNPSYSKKKLEAAKRKDKLAFETEFLARFRTDLSGMYDPFIIDKAVSYDRPLEVPYRADIGPYICFVDCAGGGGKDHYAIAIGHRENEKIIIDVVRSRAPKFNPDEVTAQYCELVKQYGVYSVIGDKFSGDWSLNSYAKHGINYVRSEKTKSELYLEAEGAFNTEMVMLPNKDSAITQLKNLVRRAKSGGRDSVDTDSGQSEDEANVIAGVISLLGTERKVGWAFGVGSGDDEKEDTEPSPSLEMAFRNALRKDRNLWR